MSDTPTSAPDGAADTTRTTPQRQGPTRPCKPRLVRWLIGLPVAFFAILMAMGYLFNTPETEDRWVARETIRLCWKEVQKPPKEGKPVHFTQQSECEKLEFDFKTQYGENPDSGA
jgi:hypothetical protein